MRTRRAGYLHTGSGSFAALTIVYLLYAALLKPWGDFPLNDDWVYARNALRSLERGSLSFSGWEMAWGIPQAIWGALLVKLFPFSHALLRITGLLCALFSAAAIHVHLLRKSSPPLHAACGAGMFLFFTPVVASSFTFMLDLPFVALWLWALLIYEIAWERRSCGLGALGTLVAVLCLLQRQIGVCVVLTAGAWFGWQAIAMTAPNRRALPRAARLFPVCLTVLNLGALAVFALVSRWWANLPHLAPAIAPESVVIARAFRYGVMSLVYAGVLAFPLRALLPRGTRPLATPGETERGLTIVAAAALIICFAFLALDGHLMPYFGNFVSDAGYFNSGEVLFGEREKILGCGARIVVTLAGFLGAFHLLRALIEILTRRNREPAAGFPPPPRLLLPGTVLYTLAIVAGPATMFDRYLLPLFALVPILLLEPRDGAGRPGTAKVCAIVVAWALLSFPFQWDYLRWNEARWRAGRDAVAQGIPAAAVEAGYEWDGWHRNLRPASSPQPQETPFGWYSVLFEAQTAHALVCFSDQPNLVTIGRYDYRSLLTPGKIRSLYLERL